MRIQRLNQNAQLSHKLINGMNIAELSFLFARYTNHGKENLTGWSIFEPTRFMYLFQTFNIIYDYEWQNLNNNYENFIENLYNCNKDEENRIFAKSKISNLHSFIKDNSEVNYIKLSIKNFIFEQNNQKIVDKFKQTSSEITNIKYNEKELKFILKNITSKENWDANLVSSRHNIDFIIELLKYLYQIRNNLFHGNKKIDSLLSKSQLDRIEFYNKFLEAYVECFFKHLESKFNYNRITKSQLDSILED
jgi:hypothetical protein